MIRREEIDILFVNAGVAKFAPFAGTGSGRIKGSAFLKTRSGDVKLGAGNKVYLMPATAYTDEWFTKSVVDGESGGPPFTQASNPGGITSPEFLGNGLVSYANARRTS